jgi:adenylosuccinate synthase
MNEVLMITGLGIGEETKASSVEWSAKQINAHTILRSGGCQSGHNVITEDGVEQQFSHFGSGTLDGVRTHLKHMVINPVNLFTEAIELENKKVEDPFNLITIDEDCLTVTPFHGAISRIREVLLGNDKKGTVGMGVGDAIKDSNNPELTIHAGDFLKDENFLHIKIEAIRQYKIKQAINLISLHLESGDIPERVYSEMEILYDESLVNTTVDSFKCTADLFKIVGDEYLDEILSKEGGIVCEASHGALLHPRDGFLPHVTQIDPTGQDVLKTLKEHNYSGKIVRLGVSRCYMTRHGAGPLVSYSEEMTKSIQETHNNTANDWLGEFRNGNYDIVAMKYAIKISGGKESFNGLKISYMDILSQRNEWKVCEGYKLDSEETDFEDFFNVENGIITEIKIHPDTDKQEHENHQLRLTELLKKCQPILKILKPTEEKTLEQVFIEYVEENIKIPVVTLAYGPKASDRKIRPGYENLFTD